jgi:transposase
LIATGSYKRLSVSGALAYKKNPQNIRTRLCFEIIENSYNSLKIISFLKSLRRYLVGEKVVLIWDNLRGHISKEVRAFLHLQRHWLTVEQLPSYAPDLNPVEQLWSSLKRREMANFCAYDLDELHSRAKNGLKRIRSSRSLALSFLKHADLSL